MAETKPAMASETHTAGDIIRMLPGMLCDVVFYITNDQGNDIEFALRGMRGISPSSFEKMKEDALRNAVIPGVSENPRLMTDEEVINYMKRERAERDGDDPDEWDEDEDDARATRPSS